MNISELEQGQELTAIMTPDYNAEGTMPLKVGEMGCSSITVTQLCGTAGFYDCAKVQFDNGLRTQIIPLHQCDFIQI